MMKCECSMISLAVWTEHTGTQSWIFGQRGPHMEQNIILGRTVAEVLSNFSYHIDIILLIFLYVEVTPSVLYQIILRN